jgi:hypothetical protein
MYITETGIADATDDRRTQFINSYFKVVRGHWWHQPALGEGESIRLAEASCTLWNTT